jgi:hypothetical protein
MYLEKQKQLTIGTEGVIFKIHIFVGAHIYTCQKEILTHDK